MANNDQYSTGGFPAYLNYPAYSVNTAHPQTKQRDYLILGLSLSLVVFLVVALIMTILSVTILARWIPELALMALMLITSIGAAIATAVYFSRLDDKQQKNKKSPYTY